MCLMRSVLLTVIQCYELRPSVNINLSTEMGSILSTVWKMETTGSGFHPSDPGLWSVRDNTYTDPE